MSSLPDAKPSKQGIKHVLGGRASKQGIKGNPRQTKVFCHQQWIDQMVRQIQSLSRFGQQAVLAGIECRVTRLGQFLSSGLDKIKPQRR